MHDSSGIRTFLFCEASRGEPRADVAARIVAEHRGSVAKWMAAGFYAVFEEGVDAIAASIELHRAAGLAAADPVRCGIHAGHCEHRGNSYYGVAVNRAAHILGAAHAGQTLVSQSVAAGAAARLPMGVALRDAGVARLRDLCRPERIYQVYAPGLRSDFPPLRSLDDVPNNLPEAAVSFIGRTREIAEVHELLRSHRLVTLLGMAGVGKTRLALHAAGESFDAYRDGVWLVELAAVHAGNGVAQAIASTLGVRHANDEPLEEALVAHVAGREMLLVLDNCEHVLEGAARTACEMLSAGPGVRILATSREPLRISHEARYLVPGLSVPPDGAAREREAIARYFAVRLFVDRAHATSPGFGLTAANSRLVASICNELDGIPLAIEIAAAHLPAAGLEQISASVSERVRALDGDAVTPARHHILHAMIDWSYRLLVPEERALLRRLAVFSGSWSAEAARVVCTAQGEGDPVQGLANLARKSLIMPDGARYRMHEAVRDYALVRLREAGEDVDAAERHLRFFSELAVAARPQLAGPRQAEWLANLDADRDNLLAAHARSLESPARAVAGLRLANALKLYWMNRGLAQLGLKLVSQSLEGAGELAGAADRAQALFNAGQLRYFLGRHAQARECLERSLAIARTIAEARAANVLQPLGMAALAQGDLAYARRCFEESLAIARRLDDGNCAAGALNALAMLHRIAGHPEQSRPLYEAVVRLAIDSGNIEVHAIGLLNHAMACIDLGDAKRGRRDLEAAIAIANRTGSAPASQAALDVCAALACLAGDWIRAARLSGAADVQAERSGLPRDAADTMFIEPKLALARDAVGAEAFGTAYREGRRCGLDQALREARLWLGESSAPEAALATSR
jgi:predicted ATPase